MKTVSIIFPWIAPLFLGATLVADTVDVRELDPAHADIDRDGLAWYDLQSLQVDGQGWTDVESVYDRLPARAKAMVRGPVWGLSHHSAGLTADFRTDATSIHVRWELTSDRLAMPHMPASGVSGLDLYVRSASAPGPWRWAANGRPTARVSTAKLVSGLIPGTRDFRLYLPLYNGVRVVEVGIPSGHRIQRLDRSVDAPKPCVFYGTSITQGGCASRPGMVHTSILGRRLNWPVINLGFSGNGRMEIEMAELIAELDASVYVLDCLPNMSAELIEERFKPFVQLLRQERPHVPILLVEDRTYADAFIHPSRQERNRSNRAALRAVWSDLLRAGVSDLHYLAGDQLLGLDGEDTVDGSHPTDLGFVRQADAFMKVLAPILGRR